MLAIELKEKAEGLKRCYVLKSMSQSEIESLVQDAQFQTYDPKEFIFTQGDLVDGLYILSTGFVKLSRLNPNGQQKVVKLCGPGEIFGELIYLDEETRTLQAEVVETATACKLSKTRFRQLLERRADVAARYIEVISRRLNDAYLELEEMAYETAYRRLCRLLLQLCETFQIPIEPGCLIDLRVTQEDLAEMLGTTRMTVTTAVGQLRQAEIMFGRSGKLQLDHQRLQVEVDSWD